MASRYYITKHWPGHRIDGPYRGSWGDIAGDSPNFGTNVYRVKTSKAGGGRLRTFTHRSNRSNNYDVFILKLMTPPLAAQTISGTFDLMFRVQSAWETYPGPVSTAESVVRYKLHIFITVGESATVRHVLLDNFIDTADWPKTPTVATYQALATAATLTAGTALEGDCVLVEFGCRIVSAPTPPATYPLTQGTFIPCQGHGTSNASDVAYADAAAGDTADRAPWIEFSADLVEAAAAARPDNDSGTTAIVISSVPYESEFIDTTSSTGGPIGGTAGNGRTVFWKIVAPRTGLLFVAARGSNFPVNIWFMTPGFTSSDVVGPNFGYAFSTQFPFSGRSLGASAHDVVAGTTYYIAVEHSTSGLYEFGSNSGGACRIVVFYRETPEVNDLYVPASDITVLREYGNTMFPVNLSQALQNLSATSIAIDYTKKPMVPLSGDHANPHVGERVVVGLFTSDLLEVLNIETMSWAPQANEIDFHDLSSQTARNIPSSTHITRAGYAWTGFWGNGLLLLGGDGFLVVTLDSPSVPSSLGAPLGVNTWEAQNHPGGAGTHTSLSPVPDVEFTTPVSITVDETNNIMFYTSGGYYSPRTGDTPSRRNIEAMKVKRYDLTNMAQLSDLATLTPGTGFNPGLKGLIFVPKDGSVLVCNSPVVVRLSSTGAVMRTYTPSIPDEAQSLQDVRLTDDQSAFYTIDSTSTRIFKFAIETGEELLTYQPYSRIGSNHQMAIYLPLGYTAEAVPTEYLIRRQRVVPHLLEEDYWFFYHTAQLDLETGSTELMEGQGSEPQVMLDWSDDGGYTWSNEHWRPVGKQGEYASRVLWRRLGRSRDRIFRITVSDPIKWALIDMYLKARKGSH